MHADTCCAENNLELMEYTGDIFEVSPFLKYYDPVKNNYVRRC